MFAAHLSTSVHTHTWPDASRWYGSEYSSAKTYAATARAGLPETRGEETDERSR